MALSTDVRSLEEMCMDYLCRNFQRYSISNITGLPSPVVNDLMRHLSPLNLRRLEIAMKVPDTANQDIWLRHYAQNFAIYYRGMFKATQTNENIYCVVTRDDKDYRRRFLEDNFHVLLEDANKITILLQRGVFEVNPIKTSDLAANQEKACCHVKMEQIKSDMLLCAPFVKSLKVFRSKVLMSALLKDVLDILTRSVICIRLVFLHDYHVLKDTIQHFMHKGHILDFHTTWQPQRCSLPAKCSVEILTLLAGLQLPTIVDCEALGEASTSAATAEEEITWNPYDLYDIAVSGSRITQGADNVTYECAAVQDTKSASHVSISSFMLTQNQEVHKYVANTLLQRWASLKSLKLACLNRIDIDIFKTPITDLIRYHNLRQLCFEDTQFSNPMDLFISILRIVMKHKDIVMKKLTMLGIGHPFIGDHAAEIIKAGSFEGITSLDLSFSSLNHPQCIPTFCEYLKRDKALRLLNINCCKLPCGEDSGEYTAQLLRAIGLSSITELVLDFNPINGAQQEDAMIEMLETNKRIESLSCTLCSFNQVFLTKRLLPAIGNLPKLDKLYLAENRIGNVPELKELLEKLLTTRSHLTYLDVSSNFLSGNYLLEIVDSLTGLRGEKQLLFKGLNLSFNLGRDEAVVKQKDIIREKYKTVCQHLFCMILYEDPGEPARREHLAQM